MFLTNKHTQTGASSANDTTGQQGSAPTADPPPPSQPQPVPNPPWAMPPQKAMLQNAAQPTQRPFNPRDYPEWLRVKEACEYSRLSKPKLYQLINAGRIKSVSLRERGQIRGTRLISSDSLRAFLESRATGGEHFGH